MYRPLLGLEKNKTASVCQKSSQSDEEGGHRNKQETWNCLVAVALGMPLLILFPISVFFVFCFFFGFLVTHDSHLTFRPVFVHLILQVAKITWIKKDLMSKPEVRQKKMQYLTKATFSLVSGPPPPSLKSLSISPKILPVFCFKLTPDYQTPPHHCCPVPFSSEAWSILFSFVR